jgi:hypothetical protein
MQMKNRLFPPALRYRHVKFLLFANAMSTLKQHYTLLNGLTYLTHEEHLGSALSHFLFRTLHEMHTCRACSRLDSLLRSCIKKSAFGYLVKGLVKGGYPKKL